MAKTEEESKKKNEQQGERDKNKSANKKKQDENKGEKEETKKGGKKGGKKKKPEYKPGMPSYMYDPCPHRVWTPKPGERDRSEPRGTGSPWNEPGRKYEDVVKEQDEKNQKKEEKAAQKRQKAHEEKQKKKEEEEKKKKEEEEKQKEKEKQKEEKKKEREKKKKKKEDEKRQKQKEERDKKKKQEEDKKKKEEEDKNKKGGKDDKGKDKEKDKKKEEPFPASYMYDPCPHRVYTPGPGEKDLADPKGVGSPWYIPTKKKEDIDKEEAEKEEEDNKKRKERSKQHKKEQREKEKKEEQQRRKEEAKRRRREQKIAEIREQRRQEREEKRREREKEEQEKYMGQGASPDKIDLTPELMLMFDFISGVDEEEREKRGEALQMRKEEIEAEMESHLAKEAFTNDFKELVSTMVEAEWGKADKRLKELKRDERRRRREIFKNMDPLAKDMIAEATRFNSLFKGAMGIKESEKEKRGIGEPSVMEDTMVSMIIRQMDKLMPDTQAAVGEMLRRSVLTAN